MGNNINRKSAMQLRVQVPLGSHEAAAAAGRAPARHGHGRAGARRQAAPVCQVKAARGSRVGRGRGRGRGGGGGPALTQLAARARSATHPRCTRRWARFPFLFGQRNICGCRLVCDEIKLMTSPRVSLRLDGRVARSATLQPESVRGGRPSPKNDFPVF